MNDFNSILEKYNPSVFEPVIIGTLLTSPDVQPLYDILKIRVKPVMFSEKHKDIAEIIFDMMECDEPLRNYLIIEKGLKSGFNFTTKQITDYRIVKTESSFLETVESFVNQWYDFNISKNNLQFSNDLITMTAKEANLKLNDSNSEIENIKNQFSDKHMSIKVAAEKVIEDIELRSQSKNKLSGISFGFKNIDKMTGGLHPKMLYLIAGAGGEGKTTMAINFAIFMSKFFEVDFYSLEMSVMQVVPKILSSETGISRSQMLHANVTNHEINQLKKTELNHKLNIIDNIFSLRELKVSIRARAKKHNTRAIFIDNRTIITHNIKGNLDESTTKLTYEFKILSMETGIPIVLLVHKNKEANTLTDKRPTTSSVKYGGDIAADVVMFPYSPIMQEDEKRQDGLTKAEIIITKNRVMGSTGVNPVLFDERHDSYFEMDSYENPIIGYNPYDDTENINNKKLTNQDNIITMKNKNVDEMPF